MTTIRLTFTAGRYHATPWGRHVNEGVPEWPPAPYRLLRALYDVWQRKCFDLPEDQVRGVLESLAGSAPRYALPAAVATHTRSYLSANSKDPTDKNLVFDSFLVFDRPEPCFVTWPDLDLGPESRAVLTTLLRNLNYLGRSESWVDAEVWNGAEQARFRSEPSNGGFGQEGEELARIACVISPEEYEGKEAWMDALTYSTTRMLKERASNPPLLRQVRYRLPQEAIETDPESAAVRKKVMDQAVMLSLDSTVLPLVTATLEVAEQVRVRLMGAHRKRMGGDEAKVSALFSGKGEDGGKRLDHGHLYILPQGNEDGRIDRILLVSPLRSLERDELDAVRGVRELYQRDGRPGVRCVLTWQGGLDSTVARRRTRVVESVTPFVAPRHPKKNRDFGQFLKSEILRECANHRIGATPVEIEIREDIRGHFHCVEYRRNRKEDPVRPGYAFRLTFEEEVAAPFAIGYGAHFGLGQFTAVASGGN